MTEQPSPLPRELAEIELDNMRHSSRVRLAQAAGRVRLGLAELEHGILEALLQEAALNLSAGKCPGRVGCAPNVRRIVADAIAARLADVLTPYLFGDEEWEAGSSDAEAELAALCELGADDAPA